MLLRACSKKVGRRMTKGRATVPSLQFFLSRINDLGNERVDGNKKLALRCERRTEDRGQSSLVRGGGFGGLLCGT
jgi:hypothetical protein